jgi:hypothetical protein
MSEPKVSVEEMIASIDYCDRIGIGRHRRPLAAARAYILEARNQLASREESANDARTDCSNHNHGPWINTRGGLRCERCGVTPVGAWQEARRDAERLTLDLSLIRTAVEARDGELTSNAVARALLDRKAEWAKEVRMRDVEITAELRNVTGPTFPCGHYEVEHSETGHGYECVNGRQCITKEELLRDHPDIAAEMGLTKEGANEHERCASHACLIRQSDDPCTNYKHGKSRGLCATCFNVGCPTPESVLAIKEGAPS